MSALAASTVILWVLVLALSLVVVALARQLGVLHERIAPVGALMLAKGLRVGEAAPSLNVTDIAGRSLAIAGARASNRSQLLLFVSPTCPVCKALIPVLRSSRRTEQSWLDVVLASDGDLARQQAFVRENALESFPYVVSATLGLAYRVNRLPYAALVDPEGVLRARGIINSREHLESLFEAQRVGFASLQDYLEQHSRDRAA